VAPHEKRVSLIGIPLAYVVIVNFFLMLPTFSWPSAQEFALLLCIGGIGGTANVLFINATRIVKASDIAPMQYSQIAFAVVFGFLFFHEYPDAVAYVGLAIVVTFGILNVISDGTRIRIFSRLSIFGPATVAAEVAKPLDEDEPIEDRRDAA
jgi:drug/metabolite transporter (DMT)-like permease